MIPEPEAEPSCPECGGRGWVVEPDGKSGSARLCKCRVKQRLPMLLTSAGIPPRYKHCVLRAGEGGSFRVKVDGVANKQLENALFVARQYVEGFLVEGGRFRESGLLFMGPPGVGKTHLAVAVLTDLINLYGVRGKFVDFTTLLFEIQATFDQQVADSKQAILQPVLDAEVLVLDELGAQKPSDWVQNMLYLVLNHRYTRRMPTLFTSNYFLEPGKRAVSLDRGREAPDQDPALASRVSPALLSRLHEMAEPVSIQGVDYRQHQVQMHPRR